MTTGKVERKGLLGFYVLIAVYLTCLPSQGRDSNKNRDMGKEQYQWKKLLSALLSRAHPACCFPTPEPPGQWWHYQWVGPSYINHETIWSCTDLPVGQSHGVILSIEVSSSWITLDYVVKNKQTNKLASIPCFLPVIHLSKQLRHFSRNSPKTTRGSLCLS